MEGKVLLTAAYHGRDEVVRVLIERGMPAASQSNEALRLSVTHGYHALAEYLLKSDANVHVDDDVCLMTGSFPDKGIINESGGEKRSGHACGVGKVQGEFECARRLCDSIGVQS
jgi:hypothetical protein